MEADPEPAQPSSLVHALREAVDDLVGSDPSARPIEGQEADLIALQVELNRLEAVRGRNLVAFENHNGSSLCAGLRHTRDWMVERLKIGRCAAGRMLRAGRASFDDTWRGSGVPRQTALLRSGEVWLHGEVSGDQVAQIANLEQSMRRMQEWPWDDDGIAQRQDAESSMLDFARKFDAETMHENLSHVRGQYLQEKEALANAAAWEDRSFRVSPGMGGTAQASATLTPEGLALARAVLAAFGKRQGKEDERTPVQRHHDAMVGAWKVLYEEGHLDVAADTGQLTVVPEPRGEESERPIRPLAAMEMVATKETLDGSSEVPASLYDGLPVDASTARKVACDASVSLLVIDEHQRCVEQSHRRGVPSWLRRRIRIRDGNRCRFPGCSNPIDDVHHLKPWAQGGLTTANNLCGLCSFHHNLVHHEGWTLRGDPELGQLEALPPVRGDPVQVVRRIRAVRPNFRPWMFRH